MIKIYKNALGLDGEITTIKGKIKRILTAQFQPDSGPCVWYEVDDDLKDIEVKIIAIGTGWELPKEIKFWNYIGTVQDGMGFVWHYYATPFNNTNIEKDLGDIFGAFFGAGVN
jgi:hypothetical protein